MAMTSLTRTPIHTATHRPRSLVKLSPGPSALAGAMLQTCLLPALSLACFLDGLQTYVVGSLSPGWTAWVCALVCQMNARDSLLAVPRTPISTPSPPHHIQILQDCAPFLKELPILALLLGPGSVFLREQLALGVS